VPVSNLLDVIVQAADALSGARPGARREMLETYIRRLEELERIIYPDRRCLLFLVHLKPIRPRKSPHAGGLEDGSPGTTCTGVTGEPGQWSSAGEVVGAGV